jgi:excinuclease ABC subunit C
MVRGEYAERLREKAASLPLSPGVYIMRDTTGKVIYVGKSRALKNRVSGYFQESGQNSFKTDAMTSHIFDFDYILCDTEMEALTLENSLIKLYHPRYNIKLKDDKSYPYLKATVGEEFPRFVMTRKRESEKAKYFGPYTSTQTVYGIISALQKTFGLPSCRYHFPKDRGRVKTCIYKQIGCIAPCDPAVSSETYREAFMQAVSFLSGNYEKIVASLTEKMEYAAENLAFEAAAAYRDRIKAVKKLEEKQKVVASPDTERDIIAWHVGDPISSICIFYIRFGKLIDSEMFYFSGGEILDSDAVVSFIYELYTRREYIPKEVDTADILAEEDAEALSSWLTEKAGYRVYVRTPFKGETRRLCDMARENAEVRAREYAKAAEKSEKSLVRLASLCGLETVPERIEAFDISNFGDDNITAGMVVYENAKPKKSDYRLFHIKSTETRDDYASMREAVARHLVHLSDEGAKMPDLMLIDGGENHRAIAAEEVAAAGYDIPVFGMVKDEYHKTRALVGEMGEISIAAEQSVYTLIYNIQEEVHRFTISKMSAAKRKTQKTSVLESIDGIGAARARALLAHFGGLAGVKNASPEELCAIRGVTPEIAEKIIAYFAEKE